MNDVLLTVSGNIDPEIENKIAQGERPLTDYVAMARTFNADLIDYTAARKQTGLWGIILNLIGGPNLVLAWACFMLRKKYRVIFTDGEQVGLPLALFLRLFGGSQRPRHLMITHIISVFKKMVFLDWLHVQNCIDIFFVYATQQKKFIEQRWHIEPDHVVLTPFMVDAEFFNKHLVDDTPLLESVPTDKPIIFSLGREFRDYPTLIEAVRDLDVQLVISAGSLWSKRTNSIQGHPLPPNVHVFDHRLSYKELRYMYDISQFIVIPLYNVSFQAGVTSLLESMAMEKALICSATPGQTDVVVEGETGIYVEPENPAVLREAIVNLLNAPEQAAFLGRNGRSRIDNHMSLEKYVSRLNKYVQNGRH